jgi:uncharacterized protein
VELRRHLARALSSRHPLALVCAAFAIVALAFTCAFAQSLPKLTAPVNDFAHVIDPESARTLDQRIRALQSATGDVVVVATVATFAPYGSIEEYAARLFEQAGIGQKGKDNGILIVLAMQERRVKIEVGYGLEEFVTDGFAGETIRQLMLPEFRAGQYGRGIVAGATRVIQRVAERRGVTLKDLPVQDTAADRDKGGIPTIVIVLGIFILIAILRGMIGGGRRFRRGPPFIGPTWSGWSAGGGGLFGGGFGGGGFGGGGGGGFGGFGGGSSGGGGASGGW